jgi:hypothetical protein
VAADDKTGFPGAETVPGAHAPNALPPEVSARLDALDDTPDEPALPPMPPGRSWRARPTATVGPPKTGTDTAGAVPELHTVPGPADPRRQWNASAPAGYPLPKNESLNAQAEEQANVRPAVEMLPQSAPARPRGGSTGEDPARTATLPLWTFRRWFDKLISEHPIGQITKIAFASPIASRPIQHDAEVPHGVVSPTGGGSRTYTDPVGVQPNTWRLLPRPWDEYLVNNPAPTPGVPDGSATYASQQRSRGWRAR